MNERQTLRALRDRDPRGVVAVYDRFAGGLYDYCWWLLRDHGAAREALHDTLLAAGVHAEALRKPERLRAWLYALVRAECLRRSPATPRTDEDDTTPDSGELRSLAWKATEVVPAFESDVLQLHARHGIEIVDLATILGRSIGEVETLVDEARKHVGQALRSQMLAATGPTECAELTALLDESPGDEDYEQLDKHARGCSVCSERVPRRVSVSRLMGLLPLATPPEELRQRVIDAYAEPHLLEYRLLAARRLQPLGREGFPSPGRRRHRATGGTAALATVSGLVAAGLCAGAGLFIIRMAPVADEAQAWTQGDGRMTYEQASNRPGAATGGTDDAAIASRVTPGSGGGLPGGAGPGGGTGPAFAQGLGELSPFVPSVVPSQDDGEVAGWSRPSAPGGGADQRPSPGRSPSRPGGDPPGPSPSDTSSPDPSPSDSSSPSPSGTSSPSPTDSPTPTPSSSSPSEPPSESPTSASPTGSGSVSPAS